MRDRTSASAASPQIAPRDDRDGVEPAAVIHKRRDRLEVVEGIKRSLCSCMLVSAIALCAGVAFLPLAAQAQDPNPAAGPTDEELTNRLPLRDIQVLGAHNAYNNKGPGLAQQSLTLAELLDLGIRELDLDLHSHSVSDGYYVCHDSALICAVDGVADNCAANEAGRR